MENAADFPMDDEDLITALVVCLYSCFFYMAGTTTLLSAAWLP